MGWGPRVGGGAEPLLGIGTQEDARVLRKGVLHSPPMFHACCHWRPETRRMDAEGAGRGLSLCLGLPRSPFHRGRDELSTRRG